MITESKDGALKELSSCLAHNLELKGLRILSHRDSSIEDKSWTATWRMNELLMCSGK